MIRTISSVLGIVVIAVATLFTFWDTRALAEQTAEEVAEMEEMRKYQEQRIQGIEDVLMKQQATKDAEAQLRAEWCREGKLDKSECPKE